jgi:hypothetical protein
MCVNILTFPGSHRRAVYCPVVLVEAAPKVLILRCDDHFDGNGALIANVEPCPRKVNRLRAHGHCGAEQDQSRQ